MLKYRSAHNAIEVPQREELVLNGIKGRVVQNSQRQNFSGGPCRMRKSSQARERLCKQDSKVHWTQSTEQVKEMPRTLVTDVKRA